MQKIGVFVCWCGSNIAGTVDVAAVVEAVRQVPDVAYAVDYKYMCSEQGQEIIRQAVQHSSHRTRQYRFGSLSGSRHGKSSFRS